MRNAGLDEALAWRNVNNLTYADDTTLIAVQGPQESLPTPQVKSINSLALSFVYSLILTFIHDYLKNQSFD